MDFKKSLKNPAEAFDSPQDVANDSELSNEQKIEVLTQWRYDELETEVADQENMAGEKPDKLGEINNLLLELKDKS
ncbi:MAG: hypothetical protein HLX52_05600 [Idiomarinaceae bacterium]|uniref:hypothetical protein n=1 Tax=Idiomarina TaxID=135575 RepID=UPI0002EAD47C|nr:hypothetical protein [Idiomarina sp. 28-8]MBL4856228.1 hypothetical protein [Idiomarina sp.]NWO02418.1 hypothetical protein [Idiomarinaceae bacterium]PHQ91140.1 MAG: hypothetical protein COB44_04540 [Idiomarina sp.]